LRADVSADGAKPVPERTCWVGAPEVFALSQCALIVEKAMGDACYLVGSATQRRDFRDVDVRMIVSDEKWAMLFGNQQNGEIVPFWSLLCTAVSEWMARRTGLKVDFQVQARSSVRQIDWEKPRIPLAVFPINIGPEWRDK
jgi:hypothetical protein